MLYYHKCQDCLTPFSSTEKHIDLCDCDGPVMFMGIVQGDSYIKTENRPPCDGRCTHAHGPSCDCACGGVNHGTGRVINVVVKEGKIKVIDPNKDIYDEMVRGYKYREVRDYAESLYKKLFSNIPAWTPSAREARRMLDKAKSLKIYDRRQQSLINFITKYYIEDEKKLE